MDREDPEVGLVQMAHRDLKVDEWKQAIVQGLEFRYKYGMEDHWAELEGLFYNNNDDSGSPRGPGPNLIASTGDSLISALTVPYPRVSVRARRPEFLAGAFILEALDNWFIKELKIDEVVERVSLHTFLWGRGMVKMGYDSLYGYDRNELGLSFTQFDRKGNRIEIGSNPGMPWVMASLPHDIVVPFGTTGVDDAWMIAHRIIRHIEDVRSDTKYSSNGLIPTISQKSFMESYSHSRSEKRTVEEVTEGISNKRDADDKSEYVEMWEIHDQRTGKLIVVASGYDRFLRNDDDALQLDGLPFEGLAFVPTARSFWTTPDAFYMLQPQDELDDITDITSKQRRMSLLRFMYLEGRVDEEEMNKFMSSDVGMGVKVNGEELNNSIQAFTAFNNNQNQYQDAEWTRKNARELAGFSRNQMGEFEGGRKTAREVGAVQEGSQLRLGRRQKNIRKLYEGIIRKLNQFVFSFWKDEQVQEILGPDGLKSWARFTGEQLRGEYQYEITFTNEIVPTGNDKKMEALQLYNQMRGDPMINPQGLMEYMMTAYGRDLQGVFNQNANVSLQVPGQGSSTGQGSVPAGNGQSQTPLPNL